MAEFKKKLTWEEIEEEFEKIKNFFELIPNKLKVASAELLISEIVNWGSKNYYEVLGIFEEAKLAYRENSLEIICEDEEDEEEEKEEEKEE